MSIQIVENKKFVQENYNKHDIPAKEKWIKILTKRGYTDISSDEEFKVCDIRSHKDNKECIWELEVRSNEHYDKIVSANYNSIHIPNRKKGNQSNFYVGLDEDLARCYIIKMEDVKKGSTSINNCKVDGMHTTEAFLNVPLRKAMFCDIINDRLIQCKVQPGADDED